MHNPTPLLKDKLSQRLLKHIGAIPKNTKRSDRLRLSNSLSCTVSAALYDQVTDYAKRNNTSVSKSANSALPLFMAVTLRPPTPLPRATQTRNRQISVSITDRNLRTELDLFAESQWVTVSAIIRRALYEYTLPQNPDPAATADAWGDRAQARKMVADMAG